MSARIKLAAAVAAIVAVAAPTTAAAQTVSVSASASVDVNRQGAPGSYGAFIAALNTQAMHRQRLARINNLTPAEVTVSDVSTIGGPGENTTGLDRAVTRRSAASAATRTAVTNNSVVAGVLAAGGISADRVLAITVRGHELRDVTVFYR